jgi:hypothetical protein
VQLSLFSRGAANNADFICMSVEDKTVLAADVSVLTAGVSFLELHPQQRETAVMNKKINFI